MNRGLRSLLVLPIVLGLLLPATGFSQDLKRPEEQLALAASAQRPTFLHGDQKPSETPIVGLGIAPDWKMAPKSTSTETPRTRCSAAPAAKA